MNKKIWIGGLLVLVVLAITAIAAGSVYKLVTTTTHFNVQENMQVQEWDGASWVDVPVVGGNIDLGTQDLSAGETKVRTLRARNNATSGTVDLKIEMEAVAGLTHDFLCVDSGLQYTEASNLYDLKQVSGAGWKQFQVSTYADGGLPVGALEYDTTMSRQNTLTAYDNTCA